MWVFTRYGFFSVSAIKGSKAVNLRARNREHLKSLQRHFGKRFPVLRAAKILVIPKADYPFRIAIPKRLWARVLQALAMEQDWPNFKNEVVGYQKGGDPNYIRALHDIWSRMFQYELDIEEDGQEKRVLPGFWSRPSPWPKDPAEDMLAREQSRVFDKVGKFLRRKTMRRVGPLERVENGSHNDD